MSASFCDLILAGQSLLGHVDIVPSHFGASPTVANPHVTRNLQGSGYEAMTLTYQETQ